MNSNILEALSTVNSKTYLFNVSKKEVRFIVFNYNLWDFDKDDVCYYKQVENVRISVEINTGGNEIHYKMLKNGKSFCF